LPRPSFSNIEKYNLKKACEHLEIDRGARADPDSSAHEKERISRSSVIYPGPLLKRSTSCNRRSEEADAYNREQWANYVIARFLSFCRKVISMARGVTTDELKITKDE
jgi:hypothetical protein